MTSSAKCHVQLSTLFCLISFGSKLSEGPTAFSSEGFLIRVAPNAQPHDTNNPMPHFHFLLGHYSVYSPQQNQIVIVIDSIMFLTTLLKQLDLGTLNIKAKNQDKYKAHFSFLPEEMSFAL